MSSTPQQTSSAEDWPAQMADRIEQVVGSVRDKTTGPALTVARGLVYGTFAGVVALVAVVLFVVFAVRLLDVYLPNSWFGESHTWAAHLLLGLVFTATGLFLWSRRRAAPVEQTPGS